MLEEDGKTFNLLHLLFYSVNNLYNESVCLSLKMYFKEMKLYRLVVCNIHVLIHSIYFQEMFNQMSIAS